jgi:tRNA pseudouridine38-40 synthase
MPRYRIKIEYDGTGFIGWQVQPSGASIQGRLAGAIQKMSGEIVAVRGAGRTDSGVHALGQVAHFDLARHWPAATLRDALNFHLRPDPISILECAEARPDFDARFSAVGRHYIYRILNRRSPPALLKHRVWWVARMLDAEAIKEAAPVLVGRHDFTTFRAAGCQAKSPIKTLDRLDVSIEGEEIRFDVRARSFLHNQVRSMVGSLKLVGDGRWTRADLERALSSKNRAACGPVAPASGLYLAGVTYPAATETTPPAEADVDDGEI